MSRREAFRVTIEITYTIAMALFIIGVSLRPNIVWAFMHRTPYGEFMVWGFIIGGITISITGLLHYIKMNLLP